MAPIRRNIGRAPGNFPLLNLVFPLQGEPALSEAESVARNEPEGFHLLGIRLRILFVNLLNRSACRLQIHAKLR